MCRRADPTGAKEVAPTLVFFLWMPPRVAVIHEAENPHDMGHCNRPVSGGLAPKANFMACSTTHPSDNVQHKPGILSKLRRGKYGRQGFCMAAVVLPQVFCHSWLQIPNINQGPVLVWIAFIPIFHGFVVDPGGAQLQSPGAKTNVLPKLVCIVPFVHLGKGP